MRYLTLDELIYINEQISTGEKIHTLVDGKRKVRDLGLLEAAAARPMQSVFGADAYPTLPEKTAALLHSIARNHPFADGNKRTATIAALFMLQVNGWRVTWKQADALPRIIEMAEGQQNLNAFADWLPLESCPPAPEADAERDMRAIQAIIREQQWLLNELAKQ